MCNELMVDMGDLLGMLQDCIQRSVCVSISIKLCTPRGRMRSGRRARFEDLKTASREGGEAWKTSKESGDIAHFDVTFF